MKRVEVLIPFHMIATDTDHNPGDIIEVSEEQLAKIRAVNVNMVSVIGDVEEQEQTEQEETAQEETEQEQTEQPKKTRTRKPKEQ